MYETEANTSTESLGQLPFDGVAAFADLKGKILTRTVLPWGEHCTECVWPTCYSSCDLYSPRLDGGCRRFVDGMVRIKCPDSFNGYLLKIRFKQWGKMWTPGNLNLYPAKAAVRIESNDYRLGTMLHALHLPAPVARILIKKRYGWKKRLARRHRPVRNVPTSFMLECFNPADQAVPLSVIFRSSRKDENIPSQHLISIAHGFNRVRIPFVEVSQVLNLDSPFGIEVLPAHDAEATLYFGLMDFVQELELPHAKSSPVKCVVWDLDNTLWDGILTEDGSAALQLKSRMRNILEALDSHGILQSIASKNDQEYALQMLTQLGIDHLFLSPQISWFPKGDGVRSIARDLNLALESILFVDDSDFELEQVRASCPGVRCLNALEYESILALKELRAPVTPESSRRRSLYRVEQHRKEAAATFKQDYKAFLKHCEIVLTIGSLTPDNLDRVHELTQRTNQMNFSGTRYDRGLLKGILATPYLDTYVLSCEDRFGAYGIVGFGVVDCREPRLTDLMFSCRIQSKRIEHAFLRQIIEQYTLTHGTDFHANYRKTSRNEASGKVFADLGMQETGVHEGVTSLVFPRGRAVLHDGVISIRFEQQTFLAGQPS